MKQCLLISIVSLAVFGTTLLHAAPVDECHAEFAAYVGARPYIVNPAVAERAQTSVVLVLDYPSAPMDGSVKWRMAIRSVATGETVRSLTGGSDLLVGRQTGVETGWNGRDQDGNPVPDGEYEIEAVAWFSARAGSRRLSEDGLTPPLEPLMAVSSPVRVVIDRSGRFDALFDPEKQRQRQLQHTAASLDTTFAYSFFFGTNHAHTSWSDGGMPVTDCTSGKYGYVGGAVPSDAFSYARTTGEVDFIGVVEHNHLMQEACSGCTASAVMDRYVAGFNAAQTATVPGSFVGLWGMEWGVISGGGHVNIYNQPNLMSWAGEPYHVEVPKSDYAALYSAMAAHQGALGSFGTFNHPQSADFGSWQRTAAGDAVMRGLSMISGPAFSTSTSFTPGGTTYGARYDQALSYGWKVAPEAHQDNHCWNYGNSTPNRTVALIPASTQFDQASLLAAMNGRRIYAAQDRDLQLRWSTSDAAHVMGDSFSASSPVAVSVVVSDPAGEGVQKIEIRGGRAGTVESPGAAPVVVASNTSSASLDVQLPAQAAGEEWYYYVVAVQADGDTAWSAPMWISWSAGGGGVPDTTPPTVSITSPAAGSTVSGSITVAASASDDVGISKVEFRVDGQLQATALASPYQWSWNTSTSGNGGHSLTATAHDAAGNATTSNPVSVTVSNESSGTGVDVSGWTLTQTDAAYQFVLPTGTVIPAGGYAVIARSADQTSFETFWGRTLGADVVFVNSAGKMPVINGSETYQLTNSAGAVVEGPTIAMGASGAQSIQRIDLCGAAGSASSWQVVSSGSGTPGSGAPAGCNGSVRILEFSDATGTGNYIYEFVELYNDAAAAPSDTTAPVVSVTTPADGAILRGQTPVSIAASDDVGVSSVEVLIDGVVAVTLTSAPWDWSWDTTGATNGAHQLSARATDAAGNSQTSAIHSVTVDNDVTPPAVSITSPVAGATVEGVVIVTADATDAVGVSAVELWIDGSLHGSDSAAPYEWSWDTRAMSNGTHVLEARAKDAAGNVGVSAGVSVNVSNVTGTDISGWRITQSNASLTWYVPAGTTIPSGGYVIVGRNATREAFEAFWGVSLASNVVYVNTADGMPQINGSESYAIYNGSSKVDGATVSMSSTGGESLQRIRPCTAANKANAWDRVASSMATPGSGAPASCGKGVYISEFSDAAGTGNWVYEFIELYNDL